jgi:hypothetical protein
LYSGVACQATVELIGRGGLASEPITSFLGDRSSRVSGPGRFSSPDGGRPAVDQAMAHLDPSGSPFLSDDQFN